MTPTSEDHEDLGVPLSLLASIIDSTDDAIYTKSPDAVITSWNAGAVKTYGYSAEEAVGQPISMLLPDDHKGEDITILARILAGERIGNFETERRRKDGSIIDVSLTVSPLQGPTGSIIGASVIARDITGRRRDQDARALLAAVIDSTDDAIYTKSPAGVLTSWNAAAQRMYGYAPEEAIGRPVSMLIPDHRAGEDTIVLARILGGDRIDHFETERLTKDGRLLPVAITASPIRADDGEIRGASIVARDISERMRVDAERARYVAALEDYNAIIAHDLTDPTRTIEGFAEYIELRTAETLDGKSREALKNIRASARRMGELIYGLRQYARLDALSLEPRPVALAEVVGDTVASLAGRIADCRGAVRVGELPEVQGDPVLLGQLFQNLIGNALKFRGEADPAIEIAAERAGADWVVEVADNGIGLDPAKADRVFAMYQRLHTRERYEGSGVGLAVARKIVERHGGRLWYEPRPGGGTRFRVSLRPAAVPAPAAPAR